jgi:hypothetical protein
MTPPVQKGLRQDTVGRTLTPNPAMEGKRRLLAMVPLESGMRQDKQAWQLEPTLGERVAALNGTIQWG